MNSATLLLNFGLAWVAVTLAALLSIIFLLRKMSRKENWLTCTASAANKILRRHHIAMGVALIAAGLVHGLFSSESVFSWNIGTICWFASIILGATWLLRKRLTTKGWMYYHRVLTVAFLGLIIWHVVDVGGIQAPEVLFGNQNTPVLPQTTHYSGNGAPETAMASEALETTAEPTAAPTSSYRGAQLKNGTFTGEATGYRPGIQVRVTILDNTITSVEVIDHNEVNSRYYSRPMSIVPQKIVDEQSTDVDTVTSGTFTSIGIMNAVNDALRQALVSGELPQDLELPAIRKRH